MQHTLVNSVLFKGKGLHGGEAVSMTVSPALAGERIRFIRKDIDDSKYDNVIPARWDLVEPSQLCTLLKNRDGVEVRTIEHIMATFAGCGIDNATVILDSAEVPIMDGSSLAFVEAFQNIGIKPLDAPRQAIRILKAVEVKADNGAFARFEPDSETVFDYTIDFDNALIGRQSMTFTLGSHDDFKIELANCRTFTRLADVTLLQQAGLIKGGGLDNAVVFDNDRILNTDGIRREDEPVRHKILDAVGDTYLLGMPFIGRFVCEKGGHALTNQLLRALMADRTAFMIVEDRLGIAQPHGKNIVTVPGKLVYKA